MTDLANQIERLSAAAKGPWLSSPGDIAWFIEQGAQEYIRNDLDRTLRDAVPQIIAALRAADEAEALRAALATYDKKVAECPVNKPGLKRFPKVCPKCQATSSDSCMMADLAAGDFILAARKLLERQP